MNKKSYSRYRKSRRWRTKRRTIAEIERAQLCQRAVHRLIAEETQRQENMEDITAKTLPYLNEEAEPDGMNNDWIANFFDKCRIVSDSQMQSLWSRILAGEATFLTPTQNVLLISFQNSTRTMLNCLLSYVVFVGRLKILRR